MVQDFRKANWEGFVGKMKNLNWEYLFQGQNLNIFKSLLNKFTKQFIPMKNHGTREIDHLMWRRTQGGGIIKGWEDKQGRGCIPDIFM